MTAMSQAKKAGRKAVSTIKKAGKAVGRTAKTADKVANSTIGFPYRNTKKVLKMATWPVRAVGRVVKKNVKKGIRAAK